MEDIEREQLYEFIDQSKEDLIYIQQTIEDKNIEHASYRLGILVAKHKTLIEALECIDESEEDEDCEFCCDMNKFLKGFKECKR